MTLLVVEQYTASVLNGLQTPLTPPAQAWVLPPPATQPAEFPQFYVWGGRLDESRATLPRGFGQKRVVHTIRIWAQYITSNDDGESFPVLLDAARTVLRAVQLPVPLTDPYNSEESFLQDFGEAITLEHPVPQAMSDQRFLLHVATLTVVGAEWINGA